MTIEQTVAARKNYEYLVREHGVEEVRRIRQTDSCRSVRTIMPIPTVSRSRGHPVSECFRRGSGR